VSEKSTNFYRFGDLLALARQSWVSQMAGGLSELGYEDYRRSDAVAVRLLQRGPISIGRFGSALGVTRQAARKAADGLEKRGFASMKRDPSDSRQINVALTDEGERYARAVTQVIERLNRDLSDRVDPADLASADRVLRAVLSDDHAVRVARRLPPPDAGSPVGLGRRRTGEEIGAAAGDPVPDSDDPR
jgi:DNA-binding MarR family transcriptional regulator